MNILCSDKCSCQCFFNPVRVWKLELCLHREICSSWCMLQKITSECYHIIQYSKTNENLCVDWCSTSNLSNKDWWVHGEAGSITVLPPRCGPLSPGLIPGPGAVCPFGFQSKLASASFFQGTLVFLLHLKLDFFDLVCFWSFRRPFWKAVLVHWVRLPSYIYKNA